MLPFLTVLLLFCVCLVARHRRGLFFLTLPLANVGYFALSTEIFEFGKDMPFKLYTEANTQDYMYIQWMYIVHFITIYAAIQLADGVLPSQATIEKARSFWATTSRARRLGSPFFILCISPVAFILLAIDFSLLIERPFFSSEAIQHPLMRFADLLFLLSAVLTPFMRSAALRFVAVTTVCLFFIMIGSRSAPVMIIIYVAVERFILNKKRTITQAFLFILSFYLLAVLLSMRWNNVGGLVTFIDTVGNLNFDRLIWFFNYGVNYMLTFSIVINANVVSSVVPSANWFLYAIIPLPSFAYDLSQSYDAMNRFRDHMPYPGFGYTLAFLGPLLYTLALFMSWFILGILRNIFVSRRDFIENILFSGMLFLPFLISLQYNLRTSSRIFYLFALVYFTVAIARRIRIRAPVEAARGGA